MLVIFQKHMDAQYRLDTLSRYALTLPALPEEGF